MRTFALNHVADDDLLLALAGLVAHERSTTATLLAHIAEVDARRLYLPAGHPSMYAYCVDELELSEDAAYKRIQAARAARRFPVLFDALADGRLNLSVVVLLAPHLTVENADGLIGLSHGKRKSEVEEVLARRFPRPEWFELEHCVRATEPDSDLQLAPGQVVNEVARVDAGGREGPIGQAGIVDTIGVTETAGPTCAAPRFKIEPISADRFTIQLTIDRSTPDKLSYARDLLSHANPSGDLAGVVDRALDALIARLEQRKCAATSRPRTPRRPSKNARTVPAPVRRAVWERDGGRCTFVGETGHRCASRAFLEFDHVDPVARGGTATTERMRLRCRAHNQYAAERAFGREFMEAKRQRVRRVAATGEASPPIAVKDSAPDPFAGDLIACLRVLGFRVQEVRQVVDSGLARGHATLEEGVRAALRVLGPKARSAP